MRSSGKGEGRRALPKPLVPLAGRPLLEHLLSRLLKIRPRRIILVLGHGHLQIERFLEGWDLELKAELLNPWPERENGYSLLQAEGLVGEEEQFLVAMADHLVVPEIYKAAAGPSGPGPLPRLRPAGLPGG
ncbi:MAG: NTP transferase domain-containing protein [Candidatus Bipolaricaulia bacterium]